MAMISPQPLSTQNIVTNPHTPLDMTDMYSCRHVLYKPRDPDSLHPNSVQTAVRLYQPGLVQMAVYCIGILAVCIHIYFCKLYRRYCALFLFQ